MQTERNTFFSSKFCWFHNFAHLPRENFRWQKASSSDPIINLLKKHKNPLARPICKNKTKDKVYFKLPTNVKNAHFQGKIDFNAWKQSEFPSEGNVYHVYSSKRKEYRHKLREFLNQFEFDKIIKLSQAAESNKKRFWKLIKGQRSSSQKTAFLVNDTLLTDRGKIRQMWADHFETLGTHLLMILWQRFLC